jgi:zinc/manganese transport system substrate-binding protein
MRRRLFLAGFGLVPMAARAGPSVRAVASFSLLADMLRQISGDRVEVTSLVPVDGDAHGYQPRPADARAVTAAQLVVENGLGLDSWMGRLLQSANFSGVHTIATASVAPRTLPAGKGAAAIDPHAWQDPRNGALYAQAIAAGLVAADKVNAEAYRSTGALYADEILHLDREIAAQFDTIPPAARRIITTHDAFGYYGARYGIEFLAAQGMSTEAEPSAKAVAALVAQIKRENIRAVFVENMTDPRLAQMLTRETGAVLGGTVYSDALSGPNGPAPTYLTMLRHNTALFVAAMQP